MSASVQRGASKLAQRARLTVTKNKTNRSSPNNATNVRRLSSELIDHHHDGEEFFEYDDHHDHDHDHDSPSYLTYTSGVPPMPISSKLRLIDPKREDIPSGIWPVFRLMDENGRIRTSEKDAYKFHVDTLTKEGFRHPRKEAGDSSSDNDRNINALRKDLIEQYPQHQSIFEYSDLFHPSPTSYTDISHDGEESKNTLLRCHRIMTRLREMDNILLNAQRQGRISFYLTCRGEEATYIGSASALEPEDVMLAQYREQGLLMWRGFTLEQFTNQCFGNDLDLGRGRQMPIHYGSRALNFHTISSPLGTQLPQAVGVAYKNKLDILNMANSESNQQITKPSVSIAYFGEGAASANDFHAACNFAATLKAPVIFFCRNNGYAISTSVKDQYAGDGVVSRGNGYGMASIRVDGNDVIAVHAATKAAREYALTYMEPVLIEAMTYRQGDHSTSDDSSQYRPLEEVAKVEEEADPIKRINLFLVNQGWMSEEEIEGIVSDERQAVLKALAMAEKRPPTKLDTMFEDVYQEMPLSLKRQEDELRKHLEKYPDKYS